MTLAAAAPAVSVVVPFFASSATLASCIESLLSQGSRGVPVEFLFIDNGAPDDSAEIVREYPDVVLLRESTPGAYAARNAGLRRARAPIIAFTDADCVVDQDWLEQIVRALEVPTVGVVLGACRYPQRASWALKFLAAYENAKIQYVLDHCPPACFFGYANNMAVRASLFDELGPFREWRRAGDTEFVHRVAAERPDLRVHFDPAVRVTHHEFLSFRARARRLNLYTETNAKIDTFRELTFGQRLRVLSRCRLDGQGSGR